MPAIDPSRVVGALTAVRSRIQRASASGGRDPSGIAILAVSKGFGPDAVEAALAAGLTEIGENYYQEAAEKFATVALPKAAVRHFIGRVQRNKARRIAALFDVVQTIDSLAIARALDEGAAAEGKVLDVLVQVNAADDRRQGVAPAELANFVAALNACPNLRVRGLMAMGPRDAATTAEAFASVGGQFEQLRALSPHVDTLSMGMSDDLELAVAAGSTMVRVGTALFGARPAKVTLL
ncbi:MAG: YggS family pyridoxal phosphate-dependent enzyme [Candidatus Eremiobacteraeota bacterium]|nr:YggS family pyridoxal phosphate-dependent enzyme [Candidatus Eremiobacteraeota bacterium]